MRSENKMSNTVQLPNDFTVEQVELKGFSRSVAELEWLLLILVLLYYLMPGTEIDDRPAVIAAMVGFATIPVTQGIHSAISESGTAMP